MKTWHKERKDLEEAMAIAGLIDAYNLIPKEMPVNEWPEKLIEYHWQQLHKEMISKVPSPAGEARRVRLDELRRHK